MKKTKLQEYEKLMADYMAALFSDKAAEIEAEFADKPMEPQTVVAFYNSIK